MLHCCRKCTKFCAVSFLVLGLLFLLKDLGVVNFWIVEWWTVLFLLTGLAGLGQSNCAECQASMGRSMPKKKR